MIPARCLTSFNRFQLPSSEATPWLLQPHHGNMSRSCWETLTVKMEMHCYVYITTHLKSLHWLPVKVRSTYKIACLCYHCHSSTAPSYVTGMLHIYHYYIILYYYYYYKIKRVIQLACFNHQRYIRVLRSRPLNYTTTKKFIVACISELSYITK